MKRIGRLDQKKLERTERFGGMYFCNDMWQDEYVYQGNLWLTQWYCNNVERLTELTWNGMEWIRDHIQWLAGASKESALWFAENMDWIKKIGRVGVEESETVSGLFMEASNRNCKSLEPALEYVSETEEVVNKFSQRICTR